MLDGYADFVDDGQRCNPFSNKIVLMDEVHNLIAPSDEILRNPRRMQLLRNLRQMLRTAENAVVIGFTATPLSDRADDARGLLDVVKGHRAKALSDEGFVSFYMDTPASCFPAVRPTRHRPYRAWP